MKRLLTLLLIVTLCISCLCACNGSTQPPQHENPPVTDNTPDTPPTPSIPDTTTDDAQTPIVIDHLTFEFVADWSDSDRLLTEIKNLPQLLKDCLLEKQYQVDDITVTISTAGGLTADALNNGGVDLALMPAVDYVSCTEDIQAILTTEDTPCTTVLAVSGAKAECDENFRSALAKALLETESGSTFLNTCQNDLVLIPATEEALESLREYVASLESSQQGGN